VICSRFAGITYGDGIRDLELVSLLTYHLIGSKDARMFGKYPFPESL